MSVSKVPTATTMNRMLFAAMLEWGEARGLASIATVTDLRMERILRRAGTTVSWSRPRRTNLRA